MSSSVNLRQIVKDEFLKSAVDIAYFSKRYCKIQHPMRGKINFDLYEFQESTLRELREHRFNIILKSRQMGISTLCAMYALHNMLFNKDFKILVIATKQDVAKNLVQKVQIMFELLPTFLKQGISIVSNNKLNLSFSNGSEIKAVSSSPDAARSEALSLLIIDEFAFVPDAEEIWASAQMTLATGGSAILLSTPNGVGNKFHQIWQESEEGVSTDGLDSFNPIRLPWELHPDRDQNWRDQQDALLGKRLASQECDCLWGESEVTIRDIQTKKIKKISIEELYKELEKTLYCKICGYSAKQLHQHIKSKHGLTSTEYRNSYGKEEIMQYGFNPNQKNKNEVQSDITKKSYIKIENELNSINKLFDKDLTRDILINDDYYMNFIGRTKYRTLINENPQLYKSILTHTLILDSIFDKITLPNKIQFIIEYNYDINLLKCKCGRKYTFKGYCRRCAPKYPSYDWFVRKYGIENSRHEFELNKIKRKEQSAGHLTLDWFKEQYGEDLYIEKYEDHYKKRFDTAFSCGYSKISQELFIKLKEKIPDLKYFAVQSGEYKIYLTSAERKKSGQIVYYLDLYYNKKNIEFDGSYYIKNPNYIQTRDSIMKSRGIDVLRISEIDYITDSNEIIDRCLGFLLDDTKL